MNSVVNLKEGFITFNSNIDYSLSFSKCAIGYSNYNINSHERGSLVFLTNNNANDANISMNSDIRMCIASDGNVGIAKNNPSYTLDVGGTVNCSAILVNGSSIPIYDDTALTALVNTKDLNVSNYVRETSNILLADFVARDAVLNTKIDTNDLNVSNYVRTSGSKWTANAGTIYATDLGSNIVIGQVQTGTTGSKFKVYPNSGQNACFFNGSVVMGTASSTSIFWNGLTDTYLARANGIGSFSSSSIVGDVVISSDKNIIIKSGIQSVTPSIYVKQTDGNVGIGTNNPVNKLDVNGSINIPTGSKYKINNYNLAFSNIDGTLPAAGIGTSGTLGGVKVDGSTITINNNVISATSSQWTTNGTNIYYSTGNIGIGTNADIQSKLTINPIVIDRSTFNHSEAPLTITNPTATSTSVINDSIAVLHLCRQGTDSQAYGARASFKLCRYENSAANSRTRLDITLAHNTYDDLNIMSLQSGGNVGVGTTNPQRRLHVQNHMRIGGSGPVLDFGDDTNNKIYRNGTTNELIFTTNAIDRLTIDASGLATFGGILQVNGDIRSNGNITAYYSDERLKTITEYVSDVLPTLSKIRVFRYNCNDLAASYGYDKNKKEIGLSAQEIQKYYPEVVSIAPFDTKYDEETKELISKSGEKYLTLDYERLVPILLQGIKDLNNIVEKMQENEKNMKNEINNIKLILEKLEV